MPTHISHHLHHRQHGGSADRAVPLDDTVQWIEFGGAISGEVVPVAALSDQLYDRLDGIQVTR